MRPPRDLVEAGTLPPPPLPYFCPYPCPYCTLTPSPCGLTTRKRRIGFGTVRSGQSRVCVLGRTASVRLQSLHSTSPTIMPRRYGSECDRANETQRTRNMGFAAQEAQRTQQGTLTKQELVIGQNFRVPAGMRASCPLGSGYPEGVRLSARGWAEHQREGEQVDSRLGKRIFAVCERRAAQSELGSGAPARTPTRWAWDQLGGAPCSMRVRTSDTLRASPANDCSESVAVDW